MNHKWRRQAYPALDSLPPHFVSRREIRWVYASKAAKPGEASATAGMAPGIASSITRATHQKLALNDAEAAPAHELHRPARG